MDPRRRFPIEVRRRYRYRATDRRSCPGKRRFRESKGKLRNHSVPSISFGCQAMFCARSPTRSTVESTKSMMVPARTKAGSDLESGTIHAGGDSGREIAIDGTLRHLLQTASKAATSEFLLGSLRHPATRDSIDAQILCAAHDAALEDATQVSSACLRHTYVAFLVRQGIRFADLTRLIGPLPAEIVGAYSALSPAGARLGGAQVQRLHPALREGHP